MRVFLIGFTGLLVLLVLGALAIPQGEVVTLHTVDADGRAYDSALWVVELPDGLHLRAGNPDSTWLVRIATHPLVELERDDDMRIFHAVPLDEPAARQRVNEAMAAKYGVADRLVAATVDFDRSVPVRLDPVGGPDGPAFH